MPVKQTRTKIWLLMPWLLAFPRSTAAMKLTVCSVYFSFLSLKLIPTTCNFFASGSDVKCKYIFMFSQKNLVSQRFDSLASWRCDSNCSSLISRHMLSIKFMGTYKIAFRWMPKNRYVNIGSSNGLVPSGNKPLPEPMLIKFCDAIL